MDAILEALRNINLLDLLMLLILLGGMLVGFGQGMVRQLAALIALYISIVISARFNSLLSLQITQLQPTIIPAVAQLISFFILLFLTAGVLTFLALDLLRRRLALEVGTTSRVVGAVIGLLIATLFISVSLIALTFVTASQWPGNAEDLRAGLLNARQRSNIVTVFRPVFPFIVQSIRPWVGSLPPLLDIDLQSS